MQFLRKSWHPSGPLLISGIMRKAVKWVKYICLVQWRLIDKQPTIRRVPSCAEEDDVCFFVFLKKNGNRKKITCFYSIRFFQQFLTSFRMIQLIELT